MICFRLRYTRSVICRRQEALRAPGMAGDAMVVLKECIIKHDKPNPALLADVELPPNRIANYND